MKTLLVTAFLAVAIGACSSDSSAPLATGSGGTVPQDGPCTTSADCEPNGGLTCAYPLNAACPTGSTPAAGVCVALGPPNVVSVCPCGGGPAVSATITPTYSSSPLAPGNPTCAGLTSAEGGTTTTSGDASTGGSKTGG